MSLTQHLYGPYRDKIISNLNNTLLEHFYNVMFNRGDSISNSEGTPDISGYTLIYLVPPVLSGMTFDFLPSSIITTRNSLFQAIEFSPPESVMNTNTVSSSSGVKMPYAIGKTSGGQMSISYIENMKLDIYSLHNNWFHYIEQVVLGYMDPTDDFIDSGELDYATSAFVIRFKPDMKTMVYLGKAVGIFPINLPNKDIIGRRDNVQLTTFTINYMCTDYREMALTGNELSMPKTFMDNMWVLSDFIEATAVMFGNIDLMSLGPMLINEFNSPLLSVVQAQAAEILS
jgi:hypothetical protein